jgi:GTP-binding protein
MKPVIAIVGRANVGKSTLFNRLAGKPIAIVEDLPGTTRDRVFADTSLLDQAVTLIDTGGLDPSPDSPMDQKIRYQVGAAIEEADIIIFLLDIRDGIVGTDWEIADQLRKCGKPVILAVNKADNTKLESLSDEFHKLGINSPVTISAHHGRGINDLIDQVITVLPEAVPVEDDLKSPKLAILGRPNAGKSMLLNAIIGKERAIVDQIPGTTRDATDTIFVYEGQELLLIDTAGIRRRKRAGIGVDYYSLIRSLRAINRCDIALLVIDATEYITAQDTHIAGYIKDAYKGMIIIINKWDLIADITEKEYAEHTRERLKFMAHVPILFISAKYSQGVKKIIPKAMEIWQERQKQLPNSVIDKLIKQALMAQAPPRKGLRRLDIIRAYQDGVNPPTFAFLVNDPTLVHFSYQRFLENKFRQTFGFSGTSLKLIFKKAPRRRFQRSGVKKT